MKFGLIGSHQYPFDEDLPQRLEELFELTELAAELGYDSVFAINHFLSNLATPQPVPIMARMLERSGDMRVGAGILLLPLHHPVQVAEEFATLDQLYPGRVILGVGSGYRENEFEAFGVDAERRGAILSESVRLIRELWSGEEVNFDGEFYKVTGQRIGVPVRTPGGPPIWIGAGARGAIKRSARLGDAWYAPGNSPKKNYLRDSIALHDEVLAEVGKKREGREYPVNVELYCAPTTEQAWEEALPYARGEYHTYAEYPALRWQKDRFDELVQHTLLFGSPEDLHEKMVEFRELGITNVIFRPFWLRMPPEMSRRSITLFAKEVMSALRD
jgi:alkanesulfonate monooxygenase SsuD/methylene tetrahydromethanopterin reductase-like flavin-dependent oxidoreductase (luciferase family)